MNRRAGVIGLLLLLGGCGSDRFDGRMIVGVRTASSSSAEDIVRACGDLPTVASTDIDFDPLDKEFEVTFSFENTTHDEQAVVSTCADQFDPSFVFYP